MNDTSTPPRIFHLHEIEPMTRKESFQDDLIDAISTGFVAFDQFVAAPIQTLTPRDAQACVKSGYFVNNKYFCIKVATGGGPWTANSGQMFCYSQTTGKLLGILLDEGILTELRTAAVGTLAVKLFGTKLANDNIVSVGILGTGVQSRYQLQMLQRAYPRERMEVHVWGRTKSKSVLFQAEMKQKGWDVVDIVSAPDELLSKCHVIITTTSAREPILGRKLPDSLRTKLIVCIGSDAPGKGELTNELIGRADMLIADSLLQTEERGEFQRIDQHCVRSLGNAIQDESSHRKEEGDNRFVIFDSSGVALQDCIITEKVYEALVAAESQ